ncbi:VOC family protein [Acidovorax cavernicola]|uniref:VOC family protein n=1 Tax=Acidovorax cavernicola TaxID=1675792 RepID=A0A9X8D003_9BURK|nr:VOC family protein [Acidovorax cavernicola]RIX74674.1 VOC family protein [Acidovorax cavernicola]
MTTNAITWFEIPVANLDRAQAFYETVLARKLRREAFGGETLAIFPYDDPATGGALQAGATGAAGAGTGIRIYLDCAPSIDAVLSRVEAAGGQIVAPKSALPPGMGFIAHLRDTEGNEVGLHAQA